MRDAFDVLKQDHKEVEAMLARLEAGPTAAAGASAGELETRKKLTEQLIIEESKHEGRGGAVLLASSPRAGPGGPADG